MFERSFFLTDGLIIAIRPVLTSEIWRLDFHRSDSVGSGRIRRHQTPLRLSVGLILLVLVLVLEIFAKVPLFPSKTVFFALTCLDQP